MRLARNFGPLVIATTLFTAACANDLPLSAEDSASPTTPQQVETTTSPTNEPAATSETLIPSRKDFSPDSCTQALRNERVFALSLDDAADPAQAANDAADHITAVAEVWANYAQWEGALAPKSYGALAEVWFTYASDTRALADAPNMESFFDGLAIAAEERRKATDARLQSIDDEDAFPDSRNGNPRTGYGLVTPLAAEKNPDCALAIGMVEYYVDGGDFPWNPDAN